MFSTYEGYSKRFPLRAVVQVREKDVVGVHNGHPEREMRTSLCRKWKFQV